MESVFRRLQEHLDRFPIGFPKSKTGVELKILRHLYTSDEAQVALALSIVSKNIKKIERKAARQGFIATSQELVVILDRMYKKGTVLVDKRGEPLYSLAMFAIGSFEYQVDRMTAEFARDAKEYMEHEFGEELTRTGVPQLRTIPVGQSISAEHVVASYDRAHGLVSAKTGTFAVANCVCRQSMDLLNRSCAHSDIRETCLLFGRVAEHWLDLGIARRISKDESLAILSQAEQAGMVLQPTNSINPLAICCCCGCCCGLLQVAGRLERPVEVFASNFVAEIDSATCTGCKACLKRCHMAALHPTGKTVRVDMARCIGCGVCVEVCRSKSLNLIKKTKEKVPPNSISRLYMEILKKKSGLFGLVKMMWNK